jgi:hypothetical protein
MPLLLCSLTKQFIIQDFTSREQLRFLNNGCDLKAGDFFDLLAAMPQPFQDQFWQGFRANCADNIDIKSFILTADRYEATEILRLLAHRLEQVNFLDQSLHSN